MVTGGRVTGAAALPIVGKVFIILGVVAFIASAVLATIEAYGPRTAAASGKIVAAEYYPLVEFSTDDGTVIRFTNAVRSSFWGIGDSVAVAYDPANPNNASIDGFAGRWFLSGLSGLIGGAFLLMGIVLTVLGRALMRRVITSSGR